MNRREKLPGIEVTEYLGFEKQAPATRAEKILAVVGYGCWFIVFAYFFGG